MPELQLLSNGSYHVMVTASGHGTSCWDGLAVTRWSEDATLDSGGTRCHVRDHAALAIVPTATQRSLLPTETGGHNFRDRRVIVWRRGEEIETRSELAVSLDDPIELRRVVLTNLSDRRRSLSFETGRDASDPQALDEACVSLLRKVRDVGAAKKTLEQACAYRLSVLRTLATSDADALNFQRMAASLIYATAPLRADAGVIERNRRGQSSLWGFGISGDLPIVLLHLADPEPSVVMTQMVQAQAYWNAFGLRCELAVLCAPSPDGEPSRFDRVRRELDTGDQAGRVGKPGGIFVLDAKVLDKGDRILLKSVARVVVTDADTLTLQLARRLGGARPAAGDGPVPDRLDRAELVGLVGRGIHRTRTPGNGIARLHPGLCAGGARERGPVYARCGVGGDGLRGAGRCRAGRHLPGRTLCHRRRRLHQRCTCRAWRLDLVHGVGRVDVPACRRVTARRATKREPIARAPALTKNVNDFRYALPLRLIDLRYHLPRNCSRHWASVVVDGVRAPGDTLTLIGDGRAHVALVNMARRH